MPTDGYMDAAAIGTPDGDDELRKLLRGRLAAFQLRGGDLLKGQLTDRAAARIAIHLLPAVRLHVAAAVQAERKRVLGRAADELERKLHEFPRQGSHTRAGWAINYLRSSLMTHDLAALDEGNADV